MSNPKSASNRKKKRIIQQGLRELKNKPGWDVEAFLSGPSQQEKMRDFEQQLQSNQVFSESEQCQDCLDARSTSGDDTALCDTHLAAAMGFGD